MKITDTKSSTHHHTLTFKPSPLPFECGGCHRMGFGCSYTCHDCHFDLHKVCARPINPLYHPFQSCSMDFHGHRTPDRRTCDACKRYIQGLYYSSDCGNFNLHPSCANLPPMIGGNNRNENERIILKLTDHISSKCLKCAAKNENKSWAYVSKCGNYSFHVVPCVVQMIYDEWEKRYLGYHGNNVELPPLQITRFQSSSNNTSKSSTKLKMMVSALKLILTVFIGNPVTAITNEITEFAHSMAANY